MKAGIMFESNLELNKKIAVNYIAETWINYPLPFSDLCYDRQMELKKQGVDEFNFDNREITLDMLPLTTQVLLKDLGYTEEQFDKCKHLIKKAKRWVLKTGLPHNYVMDFAEFAQWKMLLGFTCVVAN